MRARITTLHQTDFSTDSSRIFFSFWYKIHHHGYREKQFFFFYISFKFCMALLPVPVHQIILDSDRWKFSEDLFQLLSLWSSLFGLSLSLIWGFTINRNLRLSFDGQDTQILPNQLQGGNSFSSFKKTLSNYILTGRTCVVVWLPSRWVEKLRRSLLIFSPWDHFKAVILLFNKPTFVPDRISSCYVHTP